MIEKLKSFFSKQDPLYIIDRPQESELFLNARNAMGRFIQTKMRESGEQGFSWLRADLTSPSFDDMNFAYKNQVFSLLLELKINGRNILDENRKKIFREVCEKNNLLPCVFPMDARTLKPLEKDWNLFHLVTNEAINPLKVATDEKVLMSDWELNNFAISTVMQYINKDGMKIHSYCDAPEITPQVWFEDKNGKPAWVIVKYAKYPTKPSEIIIDNVEQVAATVPQFDGYVARVAFMPADGGECYRKSGYYISYPGLEKVYMARKGS